VPECLHVKDDEVTTVAIVGTITRVTICAGLILFYSYGLYSVGKNLYAEKLASRSALVSLDRAVQLAPGNATYWMRRAELHDQEGMNSTEDLQQARKQCPLDAAVLIELAIDAESRGDLRSAEELLLEAAQRSQLFQPRWTLANFYFRQNNITHFWQWTRKALELAPSNPLALFRLCWLSARNPEEIENALPHFRSVRRDYVNFLVSDGHLDAAATAVMGLLAGVQTADRDVLLDLCDRFLNQRMLKPALATWNALAQARLIPLEPLCPRDGLSLTNGSFTIQGFKRGFNWRLDNGRGVAATFGSGIAIVHFGGTQPEIGEAMYQYVPVMPDWSYKLQLQYRAEGIGEYSALRWRVLTENSDELAIVHTPQTSGWRNAEVHFRVPAGVELVRITLDYTRAPGTIHAQGELLFRAVQLVAAQ
jgi:hypothetical protein